MLFNQVDLSNLPISQVLQLKASQAITNPSSSITSYKHYRNNSSSTWGRLAHPNFVLPLNIILDQCVVVVLDTCSTAQSTQALRWLPVGCGRRFNFDTSEIDSTVVVAVRKTRSMEDGADHAVDTPSKQNKRSISKVF